jgi:hypothetical protein
VLVLSVSSAQRKKSDEDEGEGEWSRGGLQVGLWFQGGDEERRRPAHAGTGRSEELLKGLFE